MKKFVETVSNIVETTLWLVSMLCIAYVGALNVFFISNGCPDSMYQMIVHHCQVASALGIVFIGLWLCKAFSSDVSIADVKGASLFEE